jgi:hypothetical protein
MLRKILQKLKQFAETILAYPVALIVALIESWGNRNEGDEE